MKLAKEDPGSDFLEGKPVLDEFRQWAHADWPRKIKSREQLAKELADEEKTLQPGDFGYGEYGGYKNSQAKATGFFRVEQVDGKWWFVDPQGHLFLSQSLNGVGGGPRRQAARIRQRMPRPAKRSAASKPGDSTPVRRA